MPNNLDTSHDPAYCAARAVEERRLAMATADPKARAIHLELAERYELLAQADGGAPKLQVAEDQQRTG